jgi:hypothetical protein
VQAQKDPGAIPVAIRTVVSHSMTQEYPECGIPW